jgi:hypothetical protein
MCFASPPHTYWLNCNSADTVGLTPHICKGTMTSLGPSLARVQGQGQNAPSPSEVIVAVTGTDATFKRGQP